MFDPPNYVVPLKKSHAVNVDCLALELNYVDKRIDHIATFVHYMTSIPIDGIFLSSRLCAYLQRSESMVLSFLKITSLIM